MEEKTYITIVSVIFSIIAILHLLRVFLSWLAEIGGWNIPFWLSWIAVIVSGYLAYEGFKLGKK
jgi:uncharacterized membrane protein